MMNGNIDTRDEGYPVSAGDGILSSLMQHAIMVCSNGIIIVDMAPTGRRVLFVNHAWEKITGYSSAEVVGKPPGMLHREDDDQAGLSELRQAIADNLPVTVVLRNYRKDGTAFWNELSVVPVLVGSKPAGYSIGVLSDVSAQRNADRELMAWAMRLDALTTMSADGMITFDEKNRLSYVNDAFLRLTGLNGVQLRAIDTIAFDRLLGAQCDPSRPHRGITEVMDELKSRRDDSAATGQTTELRLNRPRKTILLLTIRRSSAGKTLLYFVDVTRQRQLDEMKSEFLAMAAHELRTPITSILGYSELLLLRDFDAKTRRESLEIIARQAQRVTSMINELLDLARIESGGGLDFKPEVHDLRKIIGSVAATFTGAGKRIVIEAGEQPALVYADKGKFHQALVNLMANALKFSEPQPITVSVRRKESPTSPMVGIAVEDKGIGMTAEQLARLGERFYRADPSGKIPGTGLGVALSKTIIDLHGGSLEASSEFGKGSCLTLWLPVAAPDAEARGK